MTPAGNRMVGDILHITSQKILGSNFMSLTIDKLSSAAANWSIEVTPTGASKVESFADVLEPQTCVNVTFLPGSDPADTLAVACRLHEEGMIPIPHIAARSIKDKAHLQDIISALAKQAYVSEVLVIGGGVDKPVGEFDSSLQILKSGILQSNGIFKIGVAGHPEGSPDISNDAVRQALHEKNELAVKENLQMYIETQFCFEADMVLEWEKRVRKDGNQLPIRIGIPGPATIKTLFRFAHISGIGPSMKFIAKQARNVAKLMTVQSPHLLLSGLAEGMAADHQCLIKHFHYYPFGGFVKTAKYAKAISDGNVHLSLKGGFEILEAQ